MGWMEQVENLIERFPLAEDLAELEWMEHALIADFTDSANKFRLEMMAILDD